LRTVTSTASSRDQQGVGHAAGQGFEEPVRALAHHIGRHLRQCSVVDRVGEGVAALGLGHVDPGHDVE
jgi:hypothetical protein